MASKSQYTVDDVASARLSSAPVTANKMKINELVSFAYNDQSESSTLRGTTAIMFLARSAPDYTIAVMIVAVCLTATAAAKEQRCIGSTIDSACF